MNQDQFTELLISAFEEASCAPDDYINPHYLTELLEVVENYQGVDEERMDNIRDYVQELYEL